MNCTLLLHVAAGPKWIKDLASAIATTLMSEVIVDEQCKLSPD